MSKELVSLVIVAVAVIVVAAYPRRHAPAPTSTQAPVGTGLAIPDSYSDFSGQVVSINSQKLVIRTSSFDRQGKLNTKTYEVAVTDGTTLQESAAATQVIDPKAITLNDIKLNDQVVVFSDNNIATVSSFTATKLIRYHP